MIGKKSKGMIEAEISEAVIKFEKEYMGRGPLETRTYILDDMIIVRLKGMLNKAEEKLAETAGGIELIKKIRIKLVEEMRDELGAIIKSITGCTVAGMHIDISTGSGERIVVFVLNEKLEELFYSDKKKRQ